MSLTRTGQTYLFNALKSPVAPFLLCSLGWMMAWWLNLQMPFLEKSTGVSLIFLPAGVRTVSVLIYRFRGAVGVMIGSFITGQAYFSGNRLVSQGVLIAICAVSAFSAYIAMNSVCRWRHISPDLANLSLNDIFYLVGSQSHLSATLHQIIFYSQNVNSAQQLEFRSIFIDWLAMLTGDITGSLLFLGTFSVLASNLHRWITRQ